MATIKDIEAHKILDSRGKETLEVKITTDDGNMASDSVPSGTSTGSFEAVAIDPETAVNNINDLIKPKIVGMDPSKQEEIDQAMIDLDGTKDKSKLGANAILGVSLAVARAASLSAKKPLYIHLNELFNKMSGLEIKTTIPTPMMVMIEGGKHAENNLCIQEFLCTTSLENGKKIWTRLKGLLEEKKVGAKLGLEGGFTPFLKYDEDAVELIADAITAEGLDLTKDVRLGLDVAANHCQISPHDIVTLFDRYPIYSFEDPISEDSWEDWAKMKLELERKNRDFLLVGDDLYVTDEHRLEKGISSSSANAIIIKVNQVGTVTETLKVIAKAVKANYVHIVSHRSGETMDTFISDLAVATGAKFIKSGAPYASERVIKYNRLEEIAKEL